MFKMKRSIKCGIVAASMVIGTYLLNKLSFTSTKNKVIKNIEAGQQVYNIIHLLGGPNNIIDIDANLSRLILHVKNNKLVKEEETWALNGARDLKIDENDVQVTYGEKSDILKGELQSVLLNKREIPPMIDVAFNEANVKAASQVHEDYFVAPVDGVVIPLSEVKDSTFSQHIMGDGFGVEPLNGNVVSPVKGKITIVHDAEHAITIITENGSEVLVHLGLDTVFVEGKPFNLLLKKGDMINYGDPMGTMDLDKVKKAGCGITVITVWTNHADLVSFDLEKLGLVHAGDKLGTFSM